jgi:cytochrome c
MPTVRPVIAWGVLPLLLCATIASPASAAPTQGDAQRGSQLFRNCVACHSLTPNRNMTGPSLAGVVGRTAGSLETFARYSPALRNSGVVWDETTLNAYLKSPAEFIPGNRMTFAGIKEDTARADVIAYLAQAASQSAGSGATQAPAMGGMMGGMSAARRDLKTVEAQHRVQSIRLCGDTYRITTRDGEATEFWEPNLRFITDSSDLGPVKGHPSSFRQG